MQTAIKGEFDEIVKILLTDYLDDLIDKRRDLVESMLYTGLVNMTDDKFVSLVEGVTDKEVMIVY